MNPSQTSSDDFPRLIGAENFDVWKTRVCAALDGKHLLGYIKKPDYDGVSEEESDEDKSDMSDIDDTPKAKPAENTEVDSDAVDYDESDDELKPPSDSDEDSDESSASSVQRMNLPAVRPFNHRQVRKERLRSKTQPLQPRERRRQEAKTKAFLVKTMDNMHVRLVKNLTTSCEIFHHICEKYEGASFHGDPYFIQHYLMEIKYEEGSDLTKFFLELENAMKAASEATDSVMTEGQKSLYLFHSMPSSWKNDPRIWKGQRKYIPYEDRKQSIEGKVRDIQARERYMLSKGTAETAATTSERSLVATGPPVQPEHGRNTSTVCSYCDRPRHDIRQCRGLQKDLRDGRVRAGTVLPANFACKVNSKRDHPYRNSKNWNRDRNGRNGDYNCRDINKSGRGNRKPDSGGKYRGRDQGKHRKADSDSDSGDDKDRKVFRQERRDVGLIAVATTVNPPVSLAARVNVHLDATWTIDSGCTRHVTHESQWFAEITNSCGSTTVGGNNQIPIEGLGRVERSVVDSKGNSKKLTLHGVLYAPQLQFNLLSVPAAVKHDYRFSFDRKHCAVQTDQRFKIKAPMATNTDLYQFQAQPVASATSLVASGAKPFMDSMTLRL